MESDNEVCSVMSMMDNEEHLIHQQDADVFSGINDVFDDGSEEYQEDLNLDSGFEKVKFRFLYLNKQSIWRS